MMSDCFPAEALKCNRCVPPRAGASCINKVETCSSPLDVCIRAIFQPPISSYFRRCISQADAFTLQTSPFINVFTCSTDLCN
uniref:Snake toxin/toxin-like domain-containing protein n=1 Tax=Sphaeramia orbicularis TaxID=375764 RepID=A0A673AFY2_9TELE